MYLLTAKGPQSSPHDRLERKEIVRWSARPEREAGKGVRRRGQTACCLPSRHSLYGACFCAVKSCSCCARSTRAGGCSREKRHADGFGTFNFATLVFLLLARHSPQAVSARAACVGCHQKYRESRDDVAGVLYLFSAKRYPKTPRQMPSPTSSRLTFETGAYSRVCKQTGPVSCHF